MKFAFPAEAGIQLFQKVLDPRNAYSLEPEGFCHYRDKNDPGALGCPGEALPRDPAGFRVPGAPEKIFTGPGEREKCLGLREEILRHHPGHKPTLGAARKARAKLERKKECRT